ncbi:MAG TPA: hypothetical protein VEP69_03195, partial [Thermodesulfovibrionales bacterium]|nr:hypothetical protein [Thermodesulfovibrionales bacterium]
MSFRKSITGRFIATIFLVLLISQSVGTAAFIMYIRATFMDELQSRMKHSATVMAGVGASWLRSNDFTQIDFFMDEIARDDAVTSVHMSDAQGKVFREKIKAEDADILSSNPFFYTRPLRVTVPVNADGAKIGEVSVHFTPMSINHRISSNLLLIMFYQGIVLLLLIFIVIYFFNRNIKKPVLLISKAIERITTGDLTVTVPDPGDN